MSSNTSNAPAVSSADLREMRALIEQLQQDFQSERNRLENKITHLETELVSVRCQSNSAFAPEKALKTSRRQALRKLVAGAAVAGLAATSVLSNETAQAATNTFDFNGTSTGAGVNSAVSTTSITTGAGADSKPVLFLTNNRPFVSGTDPSNLPIALRASSDNSFAIHASTTDNRSSAIYGQLVSSATLTDPLFTDTVAGVSGVSSTETGASGLSNQGVGVQGRSAATYGVAGVSKSAVGGAFASFNSTSPNTDQGAPLQLGLRDKAGRPTATFPHSAGEIYLDRSGRVFVCHVGNGVAPTAQSAPPGLNIGVNGQTTPTWRSLTPIVVTNIDPPATFTDNELHLAGQLWLNNAAGRLYISRNNFSSSATIQTLLATQGAASQYIPVNGGVQFFLLDTPAAIFNTQLLPAGTGINTNPAGSPKLTGYVEGSGAVAATNARRVFNGTGTDNQGVNIPAGAKGLLGIMNVFEGPPPPIPLDFGRVTVWREGSPIPLATTNRPATTAIYQPNLKATGNTVAVALNDQGKFTVTSAVDIHASFFCLGYYI